MSAVGQEEPQHQIAFTGNWFIDIGILGFINLMEDVTERKLKTMNWKENDVYTCEGVRCWRQLNN
jgi:hypothetical protein